MKGGVTYRVVSDHLGSPRLIVDQATGTVAERIDFDEWGVVSSDSNPGFQPFGFDGGLFDGATGLVRFGARDYQASVGRWLSKEPMGFAAERNFYAFCFGDPANLVDDDGLRPYHPVADFFTGIADSASFGLGRVLRHALDPEASCMINEDSGFYLAGELVPLVGGLARGAYAGAAKALPYVIEGGGQDLASALGMSAGRNMLRSVFRLGIPTSHALTEAAVLEKYGENAAEIAAAATRTGGFYNGAAATAAAGAGSNLAAGAGSSGGSCGCK